MRNSSLPRGWSEGCSIPSRRAELRALTGNDAAIIFAFLIFLNLFPACESAQKRLSREPSERETLVVPSLNVLLFWDLRKTLRTLCFEKRPSFGNSGVCQPLCPSSRSVDARRLRRVWFLKISLRAKRTLTNDEKYVFHKFSTYPLALLFPLKPSLVGAGCPGAVSSFASFFFCRLCWWPTVVAETSKVVCYCTRDPSFRSIARPPGLYLVHSGSCGNLPHGVCHATLLTTFTPKTQWTVANTVAFGRGVTTISTRSARVENEKYVVEGSLFLIHMRCVFLTDISLVSTMTIWRGSHETRAFVGANVQSYG